MTKAARPPRKAAIWIGVIAGVSAIVFVPVVGAGLQAKDAGSTNPVPVTQEPDTKAQNQVDGRDSKVKNPEAATVERKKQIADESSRLLKLATELKTEVDKTNKDTLSLNVIRKADAIEQLARDVKEKMKLAVGPG